MAFAVSFVSDGYLLLWYCYVLLYLRPVFNFQHRVFLFSLERCCCFGLPLFSLVTVLLLEYYIPKFILVLWDVADFVLLIKCFCLNIIFLTIETSMHNYERSFFYAKFVVAGAERRVGLEGKLSWWNALTYGISRGEMTISPLNFPDVLQWIWFVVG